ncbi:hypothetical protein CE91St46_19180 [Eubacteriales bacterium]|nr:hypothetical protein CE91St46_19180 [Eubacteriales bacterium]GKH63528.1 hypothetical protein CE91St47_19970 [Eubacteriales bacterium]
MALMGTSTLYAASRREPLVAGKGCRAAAEYIPEPQMQTQDFLSVVSVGVRPLPRSGVSAPR